MKPLYFLILLFSTNLVAQPCLSDIHITRAQFGVNYTKSTTYIKLSSSTLNSLSITVDAHKDDGYIELLPGFISSPSTLGEFRTELTYHCDSNISRETIENVPNKITHDSSVTIYPNPNTGQFFVSGIEGEFILKVLTVEGKLLERLKIKNNSSINLSLANGLYIAHISSGKKTIVKKIIIQ